MTQLITYSIISSTQRFDKSFRVYQGLCIVYDIRKGRTPEIKHSKKIRTEHFHPSRAMGEAKLEAEQLRKRNAKYYKGIINIKEVSEGDNILSSVPQHHNRIRGTSSYRSLGGYHACNETK